MSKSNATIRSYKKTIHILPNHKSGAPKHVSKSLKHFLKTNGASCYNWDNILRPFFNHLFYNRYCFQSRNLFGCLFVCLRNLAVEPNFENLAVQPNHARHYLLSNKDVKMKKNFTITLIGCMILVLKVLAMFTLSMSTIILKCAVLIYAPIC